MQQKKRTRTTGTNMHDTVLCLANDFTAGFLDSFHTFQNLTASKESTRRRPGTHAPARPNFMELDGLVAGCDDNASLLDGTCAPHSTLFLLGLNGA
jgi:hypothetical protein